jgi:hypothetical protein
VAGGSVVLLASPDDYLLEIERRALVDDWKAANPAGEVVVLDPAPSPGRLVQELLNRSLFSPTRLLVVHDSRPLIAPAAQASKEVEGLAAALGSLALDEVSLLLAATSQEEPAGALVDAVRRRGELRFLPLPPPPKPWDEVRVSAPQRRVLEDVLRRIAPAVLAVPEAVDALCETYGFRVRELAQAAERLLLGGEVTAEAVRAQAGVGECSLVQIEEALRQRDLRLVASFLATLGAGGALVGWRGERIEGKEVGSALVGSLGRLLRQALAVRVHAQQCGLGAELDPRRCGDGGWYPRAFKPRIFAKLSADIEKTPDSPLAGLSAWALHFAFRLAAAYDDHELLDALARLAESGAERLSAAAALAAVTPVLVELVGQPSRR